jgi:hypothetical protein
MFGLISGSGVRWVESMGTDGKSLVGTNSPALKITYGGDVGAPAPPPPTPPAPPANVPPATCEGWTSQCILCGMDFGGSPGSCGYADTLAIFADSADWSAPSWYSGNVTLDETMDSPFECQTRCGQTENCDYFSYESEAVLGTHAPRTLPVFWGPRTICLCFLGAKKCVPCESAQKLWPLKKRFLEPHAHVHDVLGRPGAKVTGLAQKLGQLEAVHRDLQSKSWANLQLLGQPCNFHARRAARAQVGGDPGWQRELLPRVLPQDRLRQPGLQRHLRHTGGRRLVRRVGTLASGALLGDHR